MAKKKTKVLKPKLEVDRWIEKGQFNGDEKNNEDIIDAACSMLDHNEASEIVGPGCMFKAKNGRFYQVVVEAVIRPISKGDVIDILGYDPDETNSSDDIERPKFFKR